MNIFHTDFVLGCTSTTFPLLSFWNSILVFDNLKLLGYESPTDLCTFSIFLGSFESSNAFQNDFSPFMISIYPLFALSLAWLSSL